MLNLRQTLKTLTDLETSVEAALSAGKAEVVTRCIRKVDGIVAELRSPELFAPPKNKGGRPAKTAAAPAAPSVKAAAPAKKSNKKQQELPAVDGAVSEAKH